MNKSVSNGITLASAQPIALHGVFKPRGKPLKCERSLWMWVPRHRASPRGGEGNLTTAAVGFAAR